MAGQAGVTPVDLGRLDEALSKVLKVGRDKNDLSGDFENAQPLGDGGHSHAERCGQVGSIEHLAMTAGQQREEAAKAGQIADIGDEADIALDVGLQVRGEHKLESAWG